MTKQERRTALGKQVRGMYDAAKAAQRSLTAEELRQVETLLDQAETLRLEISNEERTGALLEDLNTSAGRKAPAVTPENGQPAPTGGHDSGAGAGDGIAFRGRDQLGNPVVVLNRAGRLAQHVAELPDGIRPEEVSLGRMIRAAVTGRWADARAEQRLMMAGQDTSGGFTIQPALAAQLIDLARNEARLLQAGALIVDMPTEQLSFAKVTGDPTAGWTREGVAPTASAMTFGRVNLVANKLVALAAPTIELMEDSPNIDTALETSLAQSLALELDRAGLFGSGATGEPQGMSTAEGIQELDLGTNGLALAGYNDFSKAVQKVWQQNGTPNAVIFAPRTAGDVDRMQDGVGQPLLPPPSWALLQKLVTNQVPINQTHGGASTASTAFLGDFRQVLWGVRTSIRIEASRVADDAFTRGLVYVRAYVRGDIGYAHPEHLVKITGILAS